MSSDSHCSLSWALEVCALSGSEPGLLTVFVRKLAGQCWMYKHTNGAGLSLTCPTETSGKIDVLHPYMTVFLFHCVPVWLSGRALRQQRKRLWV